MKIQSNTKGFTLLELLVVVLIIGILAGIALPQYKMAVKKARFVNVVQTLRSLKDAEERYYTINGTFAKNLENLDITLQQNSQFSCSAQGLPTQMFCKDENIKLSLMYLPTVNYYLCENWDLNNHDNDEFCKKLFNTNTIYWEGSNKRQYAGRRFYL